MRLLARLRRDERASVLSDEADLVLPITAARPHGVGPLFFSGRVIESLLTADGRQTYTPHPLGVRGDGLPRATGDLAMV